MLHKEKQSEDQEFIWVLEVSSCDKVRHYMACLFILCTMLFQTSHLQFPVHSAVTRGSIGLLKIGKAENVWDLAAPFE